MARANAYDDTWQDGDDGWAEHVAEIVERKDSPTPGMTLFVGDSLTGGSSAMAAWVRFGEGKTPEDEEILDWMLIGDDDIDAQSQDGFGLATPYHCPSRSYTVGDGLGAWHFLPTHCTYDGCMPTAKTQQEAIELLDDCSGYPNMLNIETVLTAFPDVQFVVYESNLAADHPSDPYIYEEVIDLLLERDIVPIIITYTYRQADSFNLLVDQYNDALIALAEDKRLPLIDFQAELLARRPFEEWPGNFLSDGVHYSSGGGGFTSTSDPYLPGGDPRTHTTGDALMFNGYGLRAWLSIQKMKEIRQVLDAGPGDPTDPMGTGTSSTDGPTTGMSGDTTSVSTTAEDGVGPGPGPAPSPPTGAMGSDTATGGSQSDPSNAGCRTAPEHDAAWLILALLLPWRRRNRSADK